MLAPPDSTAQTMIFALSHTIGALDSAAEMDVDRNEEERAFFVAQRSEIEAIFEDVFTKQQNLFRHVLLIATRLQSRIEIGDAVLDRGVRAGKQRSKLEIETKDVDHVFPSDISDIVDAERQVEPDLVMQLIDRLGHVPDFPGKAALVADLQGRASRQDQSFKDRSAAGRVEGSLDALLEQAIVAGSDGLYRLEKRLLERFPREKVYVRAFFMDVKPTKRAAAKSSGGGTSTGGGGETTDKGGGSPPA